MTRPAFYCAPCDCLRYGGADMTDDDFRTFANDHPERNGCIPEWITQEDALVIYQRQRILKRAMRADADERATATGEAAV